MILLLKYLEMQGFKSFPDKTKVSFGEGLTAVVGPNGSGKSNISDAVRWVMGEQSTKTLRGDKMEDVIFTGTKSRKAQGFAEVSLTVDNLNRELQIESDEVTITRKYYRSGDSEYMINHKNVRLKDINEIFMDTGLGKDGYSLVGQGKIAEIVQSKSNERREIFEEAAGISKLRYKKNEAERNLNKAEENLSRLRDILGELQIRIEPLKEQSDKAKNFLKLSEQKKILEVSIWNDIMERSNQSLKDQSDKILASNINKEAIEKEIDDVEAKISSAYEQMKQCLISIESKRNQKNELETEIADYTSQIAVYENDIEHNNENINRINIEIETHTNANDNIEKEVIQKQEIIQNLSAKNKELNEEILKKQSELLFKEEKNQIEDKNRQNFYEELNNLLLTQNQNKMEIAQNQLNYDDITASVERNNIEYNAILKELEKFKLEENDANETLKIINEKSENLQNVSSGHKLKLNNRTLKQQEIKKESEKLGLLIKEKQQRVRLLDGLEKSNEGFFGSVKEVLKHSKIGELDGIFGTLSQIVNVKNEFSLAIETALGGSMQNIIVENEKSAKNAMNFLKQGKLGRATFLPLTTIKGNVISINGMNEFSGFINVASNLVEYDSKFNLIIQSFLGRVIVVDDIDTAVLIAKKYDYKFKIVTLDGQVVNAGGSFTGGSKNKSFGFLSRKNEILSLNNEVEILDLNYKSSIENLALVENELAKITAEYTALTSQMQTLSEDKIRLTSEKIRLSQMITQNSQRVKNMSDELKLKNEKKKSLLESLNKNSVLSNEINLSIEIVTDKINHLKQLSEDSVEIQTNLANILSDMKIKTIEINKDIESTELSIIELKKHISSTNNRESILQKEKNDLEQKNGSINLEIEKLKNLIIQQQKELASFDEQMSKITQRRQTYEKQTTELRLSTKQLSNKKEKFSADIVRLEEHHFAMQKEFDGIIAKLFDEYQLTRSESQKYAIKIENVQKSTSELNVIKSQIRNLGSVNVDSINEYKEVNERYEFLNAQIEDAEKSKRELLKLINNLTENMQEIFFDNFNKINEHFKSIFIELFSGGYAELRLSDPDNLLESGIEIIAEPPGKINKSLTSLSGGEQSFIAIAIYFAILKVHPAPFCILDEIEAALDDVNVYKYANYLRLMSDKTQFIMITHRRGTMEIADILYGVTMQEDGVSKLLQLNVSEIENSKLFNGVI